MNWNINIYKQCQPYCNVCVYCLLINILYVTICLWLPHVHTMHNSVWTSTVFDNVLLSIRVWLSGLRLYLQSDRDKTLHKVTPHFDAKYPTNGYIYGHSYYRRRIGNRSQAFEWHQLQWHWVTSNPNFKVTIIIIQRQIPLKWHHTEL